MTTGTITDKITFQDSNLSNYNEVQHKDIMTDFSYRTALQGI